MIVGVLPRTIATSSVVRPFSTNAVARVCRNRCACAPSTLDSSKTRASVRVTPRFRGGQAIQRFAKERGYWEEDGLTVLHRVEVDAVFANAIASKPGYVADSQSGIPEKKDDGSGPISSVSALAKLIASREDLNNLLLRIRLIGFWLYSWRIDRSTASQLTDAIGHLLCQ